MMLTKEECEKALESLSTPPYESSCGGCICGISDCGDCPSNKANKVLNQLIDEHFEMLNKLKTGDLSDGYHTYNELYHHRAVLFSVIINQNKEIAWKSKKHHDGTMYDGMFIVGIDTPNGQYSYHYDVYPYWNMFECNELDNAPVWDGHEPKDINRLLSIDDNPPLEFEELNKGYPIYDNDEIVCGWKFIYMIDKQYKQLLLIDEEGNVNWVNYEENRFYRKEVHK